jgi:hypothetical protein
MLCRAVQEHTVLFSESGSRERAKETKEAELRPPNVTLPSNFSESRHLWFYKHCILDSSLECYYLKRKFRGYKSVKTFVSLWHLRKLALRH